MIRRLPRASLSTAIALVGLALTLGLPAAASAATPDVTTTHAFANGASTASVWGDINPEGQTTTYAVEWDLQSSEWCTSGGASGSPANTTSATPLGFTDNIAHSVAVDLTGLSQLTSYCARVIATNGDGEGDGGQLAWLEAAPEVDTTDAFSTSAMNATVEGDINPLGQDTSYTVEYGLASSDWCTSGGVSGPSPHISDPKDLNYTDSTYHDVSVSLVQLATGAEYCARLAALSTGGEAWGNFVTFTVDLPGAVTSNASSTGGATATVTGAVNPNGETTSYAVQFDLADSAWCTSGGTSGSPADTTDPTEVGFTDASYHEVSVDVTGLTPPQDYCARLIATNVNGESDGAQVTWTQGISPDAFTFDTYSTGATTATVEGVVNPHAENTTYAAQYDVATSDWCMSDGTSGSPASTSATSVGLDSTDPEFQYVSVDLNGLSEGTDYCAQIIATDANGVAEGGQVTWTQGNPTAETFDTFATGDTTATVDGDVNPAGKPTTWQVQYDLASSDWCTSGGAFGSPAHATAPTPLGSASGDFEPVSVDLTGLSLSTDYCAEIVATNADGTSDGGQLFWSQPTPPPPPPVKTLTVSLTGSGSGRVTSSPAGIDCGSGHSSCSYGFALGAQVTLTATPAVGSAFPGWLTTGCSGKGTCTIIMNTDRSVRVDFDSVTPATSLVVVQLAGTGSGTISSVPAGIGCGSTCSFGFVVGRPVQLTAIAAGGSTFAGWSGGGCSGTGMCAVTSSSTGPVTVTATFTKNPPPKPRCKVPKVKGKKLAAAKTAIRHAHCAVGKVTKAHSKKVKKGRIIAQKPRAGTRHPAGTKVRLTVSNGRKPKK